MRKAYRCLSAMLSCVAVLALFSSSLDAQSRHAKEEFAGTMIGIGGTFGGVSKPFTLTIERNTSDADADRFVQILKKDGTDGLLKAISKEKLGRFAITGNVGRDINTVREQRTDTGRRITIIFERWLQMFELRYGTRSEDYPFTYIELYINDNGEGEGTIFPAAKIYFDKKKANTINIENFGIYPARLAAVKLLTK